MNESSWSWPSGAHGLPPALELRYDPTPPPRLAFIQDRWERGPYPARVLFTNDDPDGPMAYVQIIAMLPYGVVLSWEDDASNECFYPWHQIQTIERSNGPDA